jgi:hypothetical protein
MIRIIFCFFFLTATSYLFGQQREIVNHQHVWYNYFGNHRITEKWGLHTELLLRRANWLPETQQTLARAGIDFRLNDHMMITAGYAWIYTDRYGKLPANKAYQESRAWQQLHFVQQLARTSLQHRYRLEQRWVENYATDSTSAQIIYSNRIRYRFQTLVALNSTKIEYRTWFMAFNNEVWINFGKNVKYNIYDQNRAYGGIGYQFSTKGNVQIGYLHQAIFKADGIHVESNHTVQFAITYNVDLRKSNTTNQ